MEQTRRAALLERPMLYAKGFYFFYFAALGTLSPFLGLYYRQVGLREEQIGMLLGLQPLISLLAAPLWSGLADATRRHKQLVTISIGGAILAVFLMLFVKSFLMIIPVVVLFAFCGAPIVPLIDSAVLDMLGDRKQDYGKQRIGGTVGWGLATLAGGVVIDLVGLGWSFYGYILLIVGALIAALKLPVGDVVLGVPFWRGLGLLVKSWRWALFMLTMFLEHLSAASINMFFYLRMEDLGASKTLIGISSTMATVSEFPVFLYSAYLLRRVGPRGLILISIAAYAVRALAASLMPAPWVGLLIQLLHGLSFGAMWMAAVAYVRSMAPEGMGATAQGTLMGVLSLGTTVGSVVFGRIYESAGAPSMFRVSAMIAVAAFVFFALAGALSKKE